MPSNAKVSVLSDGAFRADIEGICYAAHNLTDGYLPLRTGRALAGTPRVVKELVPERWHMASSLCATCRQRPAAVAAVTGKDEGFYIHDYLAYNPTRETVLEEKEKAKQRMHRARSGEQEGERSPERAAEVPPEVRQDPVSRSPNGLSNESPSLPKTREPKAVKRLTEEHVLQAVDEWPQLNVLREAEKFRDYIASKGGNERGGVYKDEAAAFRNWLRREEDKLPNERNPAAQTPRRSAAARGAPIPIDRAAESRRLLERR